MDTYPLEMDKLSRTIEVVEIMRKALEDIASGRHVNFEMIDIAAEALEKIK